MQITNVFVIFFIVLMFICVSITFIAFVTLRLKRNSFSKTFDTHQKKKNCTKVMILYLQFFEIGHFIASDGEIRLVTLDRSPLKNHRTKKRNNKELSAQKRHRN